MVLIEEHDENGVNWGISFGGSNPTADKFLPLPSKEEAIRILELIEGYCEQQRPQNQFEQFMIEAETKWYKWKDEALVSLFNQATSVMQDELEVFKEKANQLKPVHGVEVVALENQVVDGNIELSITEAKLRELIANKELENIQIAISCTLVHNQVIPVAHKRVLTPTVAITQSVDDIAIDGKTILGKFQVALTPSIDTF